MSTPDASDTQAKAIPYGLTLLLILLPPFFIPNLINLYRLPKEALSLLLTMALSWLWLLGFFRKASDPQPVWPLFLPISASFLLGGASLIGALNPYEGARHLFNTALGATLFWMAVNHTNRGSVTPLFRWVAIAAAGVSLVGIIQAWGGEIPSLAQVTPPSATFGSKNMAAHYLLFSLPAAYYLLLTSSEPRREWFYSFLAAFITTYLIYTGARVAWGAAASTLIIFWCVLRARGFTPGELVSLGRRKWEFLAGITVFAVMMNTVPRSLIPGFTAEVSLDRLRSMAALETDGSAQVRFAIWANTLAMFKDHPLLGVGKGNFQFNYALYHRRVVKDPSFSVEKKAVEAHNDYVQLLAEVGLLGTAPFLWILGVLARRFWHGLRKDVDPAILATGFALAAILLEAFWDFPFENPVAIAFFWIYAGIMWKLTGEKAQRPAWTPSRRWALGLLAFLSLCTAAAAVLSFRHLAAEFHYSRAVLGNYRTQTMEEKLNLAEKDFETAIYLYPYDYRYPHWKAILLLGNGRSQEALQSNLQALRLNPYHINTINNLGAIHGALGNIPKSIQAFETALKIWPDYVSAHNSLAKLYEKAGMKEKAIDELRKILRIDPNNKRANENLKLLERG